MEQGAFFLYLRAWCHLSALKHQTGECMHRGVVIWLTGLSGAGKTTLALALQECWPALEILDGDVLRRELGSELGFSAADRNTHVRRVAFVAELLARNGVDVVVSVIAPYREVRSEVVERLGALEVFVDAPLGVLRARDPKGLYARSVRGELQGLTGVDDPYEAPLKPALHLRTDELTVAECVEKILEFRS